jgi:hypothetical protein
MIVSFARRIADTTTIYRRPIDGNPPAASTAFTRRFLSGHV